MVDEIKLDPEFYCLGCGAKRSYRGPNYCAQCGANHNDPTIKHDLTTGMPQFKPGDGCCLAFYSDVQSHTVIKVTAKTLVIQRDKATLLNGFNSGEPDALKFAPGGFCGHTSGTPRYKIEPDPNGVTTRVAWSAKRKCFQSGSSGTRVGVGRHERYDFNF